MHSVSTLLPPSSDTTTPSVVSNAAYIFPSMTVIFAIFDLGKFVSDQLTKSVDLCTPMRPAYHALDVSSYTIELNLDSPNIESLIVIGLKFIPSVDERT